jgi:peptidoglycan/xylan/chitin deacetylase (PgdA/CDA1 family)
VKKIVFLSACLIGALLWAQTTLYAVPVLMYHRVDAPDRGSSVVVSPEDFEKQMEFLKVHRYRVLPLADIFQAIREGKKIPRKTVAITFDDGTEDNIRYAFPVLYKLGLPATVFMITSQIDKPGWLTAEDLKIMDESGVAIGSHTVNHAFLPKLSAEEAKEEIHRSKRHLEAVLGHDVELFSYPAGGTTPEIEQWVQDAGYKGAVTTNYGKEKYRPFGLHRIKISSSSGNLFNFWIKISGFYHLGKKRVSYKGENAEEAYG